MGEPRRPASPATRRPRAGPRSELDECRTLIFRLRFAEAVELAADGARRALSDGLHREWRRFTTQQAAAMINLCRYAEALDLCDAVIGSVDERDDPGAVAHAWNISALVAAREDRDDVLARVDAALALGEWFAEEHGRLDSLARAACTAGTVGFAELGDSTFRSVMADVEAGAAGALPPGALIWLRAQQISTRTRWALELEHEHDPRCLALWDGALGLVRDVQAMLRADRDTPAQLMAVFDGFEGVTLAALGRPAEAAGPLTAAAEALPADDANLASTSAALLTGLGRLRSCSPGDAAAVPCSVLDGLVRAAQACGETRFEADVWRLRAQAARTRSDVGRAAFAAERFDALCARLDWRRRLQSAQLLSLRSRTLGRMSDGGGWAPDATGAGS